MKKDVEHETHFDDAGLRGFGSGVPHVLAQALPYGPPINVEVAKKAAQAAVSEMRKNRVEMTIAVVDSEWQPGSSGAIEPGGPGNH